MALPTVPLGPHHITRLIIGGNPFSGFSHQSAERDEEMLDYYTVDRIKQTLHDCEAAGINTCLMRVDPHILRMLREYYNEGGRLQWLAQQDPGEDFDRNLGCAVRTGAIAYFLHGAVVDGAYASGALGPIAEMIEKIKAKGLLAGVAGHVPEAHIALASPPLPGTLTPSPLPMGEGRREAPGEGQQGTRGARGEGTPDFHMVCFYNCGSLHAGKGDRFDTGDPPKAVEAIRQIQKPCIAYKVMGAGRVPPEDALRFAYSNIKPTDAVVVGMFPKDNPRMVEENVRLAEELAV